MWLRRAPESRTRRGQPATFWAGTRHGRAVCIGFAGALRPELEGGDLVVCSSPYRIDEDMKLSEPLNCDEALVQAAMEASQLAGLGLRSGNSLTLEEECGAPGAEDGDTCRSTSSGPTHAGNGPLPRKTHVSPEASLTTIFPC